MNIKKLKTFIKATFPYSRPNVINHCDNETTDDEIFELFTSTVDPTLNYETIGQISYMYFNRTSVVGHEDRGFCRQFNVNCAKLYVLSVKGATAGELFSEEDCRFYHGPNALTNGVDLKKGMTVTFNPKSYHALINNLKLKVLVVFYKK